jgi:subtilisin family serine protease
LKGIGVSLRLITAVLSLALLLPVLNIAPVASAEADPGLVFLADPSANLVVEASDSHSLGSVLDLVQRRGLDVTFCSFETGIMSVDPGDDAEELALEISSVDGVVSVSSELKARTTLTPDDPGISYQWALNTVDAYDAWDVSVGTHDVVVAVLDTGIDWNHPDLAANMWTNADGYHGYNIVDDNWFPMDDNIHGYDDSGDWVANLYTYHGTHVAGIVGAVTNNAVGMAGLAQVRLMAVKVMNESGEGTDAMVASGIRWAVDHGADLITMSLGVEGTSMTLSNSVTYARSRGVVMVAAAGNDGTSVVSYPAAYPEVIAVGATDDTNRRASFSNYGSNLDLVAPGVMIYSTQGGSGYQYLSGTSAAAPHVAGVAAVMLSVAPALEPDEVSSIMNQTATDISQPSYDPTTGWGIVNMFRAVESVSAPTVTITEYPEFVEPNATYSISWMVSGGDPGVIESTTLFWGTSPTAIDTATTVFSGTTWAVFTVEALPSLPGNGTLYLRAVATVDGGDYESEVLEIPVHEALPDNMLMQFIKDVQDFIFNDLGLINFLLIMVILIAIPIIIVAARPKRKRVRTVSTPPPAASAPPSRSSLDQYSLARGSAQMPPPPPPPPRFESYVDIVGDRVVPPVLRIVEGTKVVWVNRTWAPPPGVAVRSGLLDSSGEHPDSLFGSGLLVAPGDYWSVTFHRAGTYDYYLTGMWKAAKVVVEKFSGAKPVTSTPPQKPS